MAADEMEEEISILLIITVIIGTVLMTSLLICYICVFRQLCCSNEFDVDRSCSSRNSRRYTLNRNNSEGMGELTHISSQPTEIERV